MKRLWIIMALLILLSGCGGGGELVSVGGSTTVQPLSERLASEFMERYDVKVDVMGGGSTAGVKGVIKGTLDIGGISRELKDEERKACPELKDIPIACDAIAIIVNPQNPVDDLTLEQVKLIFAGEIKNWRDVGGPEGKIIPVSREEGSGTRATFVKRVMKDRKITKEAEFFDSNAAVREKVSSTPLAIGYISLGYVDKSVKAVKINGVPCTPDTARKKEYPITRMLYYVVKGEPRGIVKKFIDFVLSEEGQRIAQEEGYIRVR